jgi:hypothetical protein
MLASLLFALYLMVLILTTTKGFAGFLVFTVAALLKNAEAESYATLAWSR